MRQLNDVKDVAGLGREVTKLARDAAYVVVGLGVLGVQRAQVQRQELHGRIGNDLGIEDRLAGIRAQLAQQVHQIDELLEGAVHFVESSLEPLEDQLPPAARDLARKAHQQAREVRTQIRGRVVPAA